MSQYSKKTWSADEAITATKLNTEFAAIATAFNVLTSNNFDTSTAVPNASLAKPAADFVIPLTHAAAVGNNQVYTTARTEGMGFTPTAFTLVGVTAICGSFTNDCAVKLYYDGAAATSAITLAAAGTGVLDSSPLTTAFSASKKLEIRVETTASGTAAGITLLLHCALAHTSNA